MAEPALAPPPVPAPRLERLPEALRTTYLPFPDDAARTAWLAGEAARPHGALATLAHRALRRVASDYDVDGWLGMHPMFLAGTSTWAALLGGELLGGERPGGTLLDVGAGRGDVTSHLAPLFDRVVATETSAPMVRRLRARGYDAHRLDLAEQSLPEAPVARGVSLLHVLDRSMRPRSLLRAALSYLAPDGVVIVACPLPLRPHVDVGGYTVDPDEPLPVAGEAFEDALASLVARVLAPEGLAVRRWTRTTYLARGDRDSPLHALDDAILVLSR